MKENKSNISDFKSELRIQLDKYYNEMNITLSEGMLIHSIRIVNLVGAIYLDQNLESISASFKLNTCKLDNGIYILQVRSHSKSLIFVKKFLIERK